MILSDEQLRQKIKNSRINNLVSDGLIYESQLKVFTEALTHDEAKNEEGYKDILKTMEGRLHPEKYKKTLKYFTFPLPIVNDTRDISADLNKVFHARNANFNNTYSSKTVEAAAEELFKGMKINKYIHTIGKKVLKNKPNTFVVLDKDEQGRTYIVTIYNEDIIEAKFVLGSETELEYIQFMHSKYTNEEEKEVARIAHYDEESYRVVDLVEGNAIITISNRHTLGACPARPFLSETRNSKNPFDRYSPFAPVQSTLLNWTLYDVYLRYADHYSVYPVVEKAKDICDDDNCENGQTRRALEDGTYTAWEDCATCSSSKIIGSGTVVELDVAMLSDEKDARGVMRFVSPDIKGVEYAAKAQEARIQYLKKNTTGVTQVMEKEAVNADQVRSVMEDRRKPLLHISNMLNSIDVWIHEAAVKLAFDADMHRYANWGTEWLLMSEADIQLLFTEAKKAGMPESELDELYSQLVETKYKANPNKVRSLIVQNNLNPAPYSTLDECYMKVKNGVMSRIDLDIKANITKYIKRFERENGALSEFGQQAVRENNKTFAEVVEDIYSTLKVYAEENEKTTERAESDSEPSEEQPS